MTIYADQQNIPYKSQLLQSLIEGWKYPIISFLICFCSRLPILFHGVDLSDTGFALTNQMLIKDIGFGYLKINPSIFLSDYLSSYLQAITSNLGLIGIRLNSVILFSFLSLVVTKVMQEYVKSRAYLLLAVLLSSIVTVMPFLNSQPFHYVGYYSIPILFGVVVIALNLSLIKAPSMSKGLIIGFLNLFLFASRFTTLPMCICPLISMFFIKKSKKYIAYLAFCFSAILICIYIAFLNTLFDEGVIQYASSLHHQIENGFDWILSYYVRQIKYSLIIVPPVLALTYITYKLHRKLALIPIFITINLLFFAKYIPHFHRVLGRKSYARFWNKVFLNSKYPEESLTLGLILGLFLVTYITVNLCAWKKNKKMDQSSFNEICFLFLTSLIFCFIMGFGSGGALSMLGLGSWFLFPIAYLFSEKFPAHRIILIPTMLFIIALTQIFLILNPFRDEYVKGSKLGLIRSGKLKGIVTKKYKQEVLEDLFTQISKYTSQGDKIFAYPSVPLIYWASERKPIADFCWPWLFKEKSIAPFLQKALSNGNPKIIIRTNFVGHNSDWYREEIRKTQIDWSKYQFNFLWPWLYSDAYSVAFLEKVFSKTSSKFIVKTYYYGNPTNWAKRFTDQYERWEKTISRVWHPESVIEIDRVINEYFDLELLYWNKYFEIYRPKTKPINMEREKCYN